MGGVKRVFSNWWVLAGLAAVLAAVLLAFGLPIVLAVLRPWTIRLLLVMLTALVFAGFAVMRLMRGKTASDRMADEIGQGTSPPDAKAATSAEGQALALRVREAMASLKKASGQRRGYLYSRPWYVIIGPPGAGKTTALVNSGLRFPFSDTALKGAGGTRNLDFWFADEAVLVDTAGRYTTQDSDAAADADAWIRFLGLLKRNRPLQPINGVLVAIGLDELLSQDRAAIDRHAAAVRRRLEELQKTLQIATPVYVLFTKTDLLAGFAEYFDDLDVEGRRAVLGSTLPYPPGGTEGAGLAAAYDEVANAVSARSARRLQDELDARRRALILGFPTQWAALRPRVLRFLEGAFLSDRAWLSPLRGFYFTSGVQQGAPLDRILGGMAQVYDAAPPAPQSGSAGRAYFLNRLLGEVVIPEAGLVQFDAKARARQALQRTAAWAAIGLMALLVVTLWIVSFLHNRDFQGRLLAGAQAAQQEVKDSGVDLVEVRDTDASLEQAAASLRALRNLPRGYAERRHGPPMSMGFGLYQGGDSQAAEQAYLEAVQRIMLPRILLRLERYLHDHQQKPLDIYEPLKVYLMLGGQHAIDAKAVKAWVQHDWETEALAGGDHAALRKELGDHLDALLADPQLGRVWPGRTAPLDGPLIASTRVAMQSLSLADRAYAVLKQKATESEAPPWRADRVLASGDAKAFANGDAVLALTVQPFFTKDGYEKSYQLGLQTVQRDMENDLWVMGPDADKTAIRTQLQSVRPGVAALYAKDYVAAWTAVVDMPQPAAYFSDSLAFGAFTRDPSPLKLLLLEVVKNTDLGKTAADGAAAALGKKLGALGALAGQGAATGVDAAQVIKADFQPLADYVGSGKAAPIDEFIAAIKSAGAANAAASVASGGIGGASAQGALATATGQVAAASAGAPPMLQHFLGAAAQGGKAAATASAQGAISDDYVKTLQMACQGVVENHYPFYAAAKDDTTVTDMLHLFGAGSPFDAFARDRLTPLLDTTTPLWRWKTEDPVAAALDPVSAAAVQKAAQIRDLMASGLPIKLSVAGFGGAVTGAEFAAGGAAYRFDSAGGAPKPVIWSPSALPEARLSLLSNGQVVKTFSFEGPWAIFQLFDVAKKENAGPTAFKATFSEGAASATLKVDLPTTANPFSRGGVWSFRCPVKL